jgi:host factor-I protein
MVNRKLIRPNLAEIKERFSAPRNPNVAERPREGSGNGRPDRRRMAPLENTNAEAFYYLKQMNGQTPMVVVLNDGEELRGHIEWYDRACLKVHRPDAPNLLVFKHHIKYLYKQNDE